MTTILITQYLDTLKEIGTQRNASTVFLPHSPAGFFDMASSVREGILTANTKPNPVGLPVAQAPVAQPK